MYRVLVPVDGNEERALTQAKYVASLPNATEEVEAHLLFVFEPGSDTELPQELKQFKSASRVGSVRRAAEYLEERGVAVTTMDDSGDSASDIIRDAEDLDVAAIVMGGRKRSPSRKALFGSVTQSVILNTDRPVVVTGTAMI